MKEIAETKYELSEGFLIEPFSTSGKKGSYLLTKKEKRFEINEGIYQLIELLKKDFNLDQLAREYSQLRNKEYKPDELSWLIKRFILPLGILKGASNPDQSSEKNSPQGINQYIYLRVNLIKEQTVRPIAQRLLFLFNKQLFPWMIGIIVAMHVVFFAAFGYPSLNLSALNLYALIAIMIVYILSGIFHEFGHATACFKYGANLGSIGMGIYLYFPVFYADVTDAWKLKRSQRLVVDIGGLYFQLLFSLALMVVYFFTQSEIALYVIYLIVVATFFNLNPIFRYDGYWIFSDLIGVPNLRKRSLQLFSYYFSLLLGKKPDYQPYFFNLKKREKVLGLFYALFSNLFFIYFFYRIPVAIMGLTKMYPELLKEALPLFQEGISKMEWGPIYFGLMKILPPSIILFMIGFFLFRITRSFVIVPLKRRFSNRGPTPVLSGSD